MGWDQANRLVSFSPSATYAYDGEGLRSSKTVSGFTRGFVWDTSGGLPLLLKDGTDAYVYGPDGTPVERIAADGTVTWAHTDQPGSVRALTDSTGTVMATFAYDAYGNPAGSTGSVSTPFGFAGEYRDAESAMVYLRARYYDPATAQFASRDPLVAVTGPAYGYTDGNPLNGVDPLGLWGWKNATKFVKDHAVEIVVAAAVVCTPVSGLRRRRGRSRQRRVGHRGQRRAAGCGRFRGGWRSDAGAGRSAVQAGAGPHVREQAVDGTAGVSGQGGDDGGAPCVSPVPQRTCQRGDGQDRRRLPSEDHQRVQRFGTVRPTHTVPRRGEQRHAPGVLKMATPGMKALLELRIPADIADELLPPDEGEAIQDIARRVVYPLDHPRVSELGLIHKKRQSRGDFLYTSWNIRRTYTPAEIKEAELLCLTIRKVFEPPGEDVGTVYDETTACRHCGAGRTQMSPLRLDTYRLKKVDAAQTIAWDEWVVSARLADLLRPLLDDALRLQPVEPVPPDDWGWQQLALGDRGAAVRVSPRTQFGINPFDPDEEGEYVCPLGHVPGFNLLSEVWVERSSLTDADVTVSDVSVGWKEGEGAFRPFPLLFVTPRLWEEMRSMGVRGCSVEVARIDG